MKLFAVLSLLLSLTSAEATSRSDTARRPANAGGEVHVLPMDQDLPLQDLQGTPGLKVHTLSERAATKLLPPHVQERFLRDAGLDGPTQGWDAFERDRLALRAENQDAKTVSDRYQGRLSVTSIRSLQRMIRQYRSEQRGSR